jgi:hypothetical protein
MITTNTPYQMQWNADDADNYDLIRFLLSYSHLTLKTYTFKRVQLPPNKELQGVTKVGGFFNQMGLSVLIIFICVICVPFF